MAVYPTLFQSPYLPCYGLLLTWAWVSGWWWARQRAAGNGLPAWCIDLLVPLLWLASGLGSRLAGWLQAAVTGQAIQQRAIYGSLVAALLVSVIYARIVHVSWQRIGDTCAPPILLGVGFLRVGCFLAGCCWGDLCVDSSRVAGIHNESFRRQVQTWPALCSDALPWRVEFPVGSEAYLQHRSAGLLPPNHPGSLPVHPVQLYEVVGTWILCLSLLWFESRMRTPGTLIILSGCGYAAVRFAVELFRADQPLLPGVLTLNQYASIVLAVVSLSMLLIGRANLRASPTGLVSNATPPPSVETKRG
jgi:prolipoprotein diacylglyceryltransferase